MNQRERVLKRFEDAVAASLSNHAELVLALFGKRRQASLETVLVQQLVLSTTVTWESFLSDLFVAYIEMKPTKCMESLARRIEQSVSDKFGRAAARLTTFQPPGDPNASTIAALIDPAGWHLSLSTASKLASQANLMLAAKFAKRFSLDQEDGTFIEFSVAMRNYLGHRSTKSREDLRVTHARLTAGKNGDFVAPISNLGSFLKARNAQGHSRARLHALRLLSIAKNL